METRRSFLRATAGLIVGAVAEGRRLTIGSVSLTGPRSVEVLSYQTWTITYTAGSAGVAPGGGIRIAMRHLQRQAAVPQAVAPGEANYVSARAAGSGGSLQELSHQRQ